MIIGDGNFGVDVKFTGTANSSAYVLWDASGDTGSGQWSFGQDDHGIDVVWYGDTTSENVTWDSSADGWSFGEDDHGVDVTFYGATTSINVAWDQDDDTMEFSDNATLAFGGASAPFDLEIVSDGTNVTQTFKDDMTFAATLANKTIIIGDGNFGIDVKYANTVDSSGVVLWDSSDPGWEFGVDDHGVDVTLFGATTGITAMWDESADAMYFGDNATLGFGAATAAHDLQIVSDGTNVTQTFTDDMTITSSVINKAVIFGDGSFGTDVKFAGTVDSSAFVLWDASGDAANGQWLFGADDHGIDVIFYGATTSVSLTWDQSADTLTAAACSIVTSLNGVFENGLVVPVKAGAPTNTSAAAGSIVYDSTTSALAVCTVIGTWKEAALT